MPTSPTQPLAASRAAFLPRPLRLAVNVSIAGLWLWLYHPVFTYLAVIFSRQEFRTNQLLLLGVMAVIASRLRRERPRPHLDVAPQLFLPGLALVFGCSGLYLLSERFLDINTLSASLFGLASYGLLGLWMAPRRWRQGLPALLLLVGVLPFGEHLQTFIGYPMRVLSASIVRQGLSAAGVNSIGVDTILVFENGISQVDLPCSGVKSLWTGALFLIAATWIERRAINLRWLAAALAFGLLLFLANLARVGVLVAVGEVAGWRLLAEMLHVPLGVLGFVGACAAALALLRRQPVAADGMRATAGAAARLARPAWLAPALAGVVLALALAYAPRPATALAQAPPAWEFPPGLETEALPLSPKEIEWITSGGAESAERARFNWRGLSGSMILISSTTWRGQHRPERCFEVYGLQVDGGQTLLVAPDFPVRLVSLGYGGERGQLTAAYWFQSAQRATDDYATRMWADLTLTRQRWVLASILFERPVDPQEPEFRGLILGLQEALRRNLKGGLP